MPEMQFSGPPVPSLRVSEIFCNSETLVEILPLILNLEALGTDSPVHNESPQYHVLQRIPQPVKAKEGTIIDLSNATT